MLAVCSPSIAWELSWIVKITARYGSPKQILTFDAGARSWNAFKRFLKRVSRRSWNAFKSFVERVSWNAFEGFVKRAQTFPGTRLSVSLNAFQENLENCARPWERSWERRVKILFAYLPKVFFWGKHKLVVFFPPTGEYRSSRS